MRSDTANLDSTLRSAIALHQSGRLRDAEPLYRAVLAQAPHHFDALQLLGALHVQRGEAGTGAALLQSALAIESNNAIAHFNLGLAFLGLRQPELAIASFDAASRLDPRSPEPPNGRGRAFVALKRYDDAIASFDHALTLAPGFLAALNNRGNALRHRRRYGEALATFDRLLAQKHDDAEAWNNRGNVLADWGRVDDSIASYTRATELRPDFADAYFNRGNARLRQEHPEEAKADFDRALSIIPTNADALRCRAMAFGALGRLDDALADYDRALEIEPMDAVTANNRGAILLTLRRNADALASFDRAVHADPAYGLAWSNRGDVLLKLGRAADAVVAYGAAVANMPDFAGALMGRANALAVLGRHAEALESIREAMAAGADSSDVRFALAALGAAEVPAAAPTEYVERLFDQAAEEFDDLLVDKLKYRTPMQVIDAVRSLAPGDELDILDLGCGTGLLGPELRSMARTLVGVDLSSKMLELARARQCYDELVRSELSDYLADRFECVDLIVAADVFVYIGDLASVMERSRRALRPGGLFAFSVEATDHETFVLQPTRRYAHSLPYLRKMLQTNGFDEPNVDRRVIRQESGADVTGYIVATRRALR